MDIEAVKRDVEYTKTRFERMLHNLTLLHQQKIIIVQDINKSNNIQEKTNLIKRLHDRIAREEKYVRLLGKGLANLLSDIKSAFDECRNIHRASDKESLLLIVSLEGLLKKEEKVILFLQNTFGQMEKRIQREKKYVHRGIGEFNSGDYQKFFEEFEKEIKLEAGTFKIKDEITRIVDKGEEVILISKVVSKKVDRVVGFAIAGTTIILAGLAPELLGFFGSFLFTIGGITIGTRGI
ncbi:hypothetical protein GOV11_02140 [Candidatus Woesearchaeota archaeon]|nr:hypothetical protein [Candidatus Woesearchaeota archaeon]